MFDLKFHWSVLDKMPVGTSFRDSDHVITKKDEGWECDDCWSNLVEDSSSAYMSTPSREYALDKFAGAEIDPDDLDPRLLAFLPAGTRVADNNTEKYEGWYWFKTKSGRWVWAMEVEGAETTANYRIGIEDMSDKHYLRPFRLVSPDTAEAPEVETGPVRLTAAEATALRDIVYDNGGGKWIYTSEGGYRLTLGRNLLGQLREQLPADYAPYFTEDPRSESAPEPKSEPESEKIPEGKTRFSAAEATNFKDCRFRDRDGDVWVFNKEIERWRFILADGNLSVFLQPKKLNPAMEPFTLVEGEIEIEAEAEPETESDPAEEMEFSASEATVYTDTVFKDDEGDTWFFDYGMQRWRAMGPGWSFAREELDSLYSPYTRVGPLYEFERGWTAEEANDLKDEALEDGDGDIWTYDVPSEMWKCNNVGAPGSSELDEAYQPYRIKKAAQGRTAAPEAVVLGFDEPFQLSGDTEEVTFEGSAKEAVELLDRIARSLESIDRKLGDK